jgi:hypothetical protein
LDEGPFEIGPDERPAELAAVESDVELPETDDENGSDDGEGEKNAHRAIPAWEDAIGIIISNNLESRAKSGRAGGPRGRGRGGARGKQDRRTP